uniref:Ig-like domain-containing protein n=1 Tax=Neolamprologus brichardi TaxID=32507 RepID=A0A3Q4HEK7_NEOBR
MCTQMQKRLQSLFQSVLEGEAAEFKCKLIACPPPTILWFHNNRSIPKEHRRMIYTDSKMHAHTTSLVIHGVKEKDSGSYKIMAINTEGSAESTASLLVSLREEQSANYLGFIRQISSLKVKVGEMSEFICQFQGDPPPTVTWLKDGHPLDHNPDYDIIQKSNNSKLTIFYPTTDHEGTYDCIITNKHGKSICSATLEISNKKAPKVSGVTPDVVKIQAPMKEENQERLIEEQFQTYTDSGKVTLKVPRMEIIKRRSSDESFSTSPVEIRITAQPIHLVSLPILHCPIKSLNATRPSPTFTVCTPCRAEFSVE